jgi:hypothetical protein
MNSPLSECYGERVQGIMEERRKMKYAEKKE